MVRLCRICKNLIPAELWVSHQEDHKNQAKGPASERGYGWDHRKLRQHWARLVLKGQVQCCRCGQPIRPGEDWDLGHVDGDKGKYQGPEHRGCNRATSTHRKQRGE